MGFWNWLTGTTPPDEEITVTFTPQTATFVIEPSRRNLWRFRLVDDQTGKTLMVSAGRGSKTFASALRKVETVQGMDISNIRSNPTTPTVPEEVVAATGVTTVGGVNVVGS